jgi:predicted nucleotidyltransferase
MLERLRRAREAGVEAACALVFGSAVRGPLRADSDADVAVELRRGAPVPRLPRVPGEPAERGEHLRGEARG